MKYDKEACLREIEGLEKTCPFLPELIRGIDLRGVEIWNLIFELFEDYPMLTPTILFTTLSCRIDKTRKSIINITLSVFRAACIGGFFLESKPIKKGEGRQVVQARRLSRIIATPFYERMGPAKSEKIE